ncbi:MAG: hypothetical protein CVU17_05355 [Betaproteobacteria bacterium HGW-Betaproteobacteria-11]|nr:MAG: hypothetical protein CVU17_05355 [Betaproteobacteria bacterium HGW-Betaproteobacteria-11]
MAAPDDPPVRRPRQGKPWSPPIGVSYAESGYEENVRECFSQAVSSSSWADFSYLVAPEVVLNAAWVGSARSGGHGTNPCQH